MLSPPNPVKTVDIDCHNPCFTIDDGTACTKHIHIYRKGAKPRIDTCKLPINPYELVCSSDTNEKEFEVECEPYEEWHTVSGTYKSVCVCDELFRASDGIWIIDVYEEIQTVSVDKGTPDPSNLYRTIPPREGDNRVGKKLCDTYEFYVDGGCEVEIKKCTDKNTSTDPIMD